MEFGTRIIHIGDKSIKLQIWDTAGQVREKKNLIKSDFSLYIHTMYLGTI